MANIYVNAMRERPFSFLWLNIKEHRTYKMSPDWVTKGKIILSSLSQKILLQNTPSCQSLNTILHCSFYALIQLRNKHVCKQYRFQKNWCFFTAQPKTRTYCINSSIRHLLISNYVSDPRVESWPLMSPISPLTITFAYLYLIYKLLPQYMQNRKPFDLKVVLVVYNVFQVAACCIIIYGVSTNLQFALFQLRDHDPIHIFRTQISNCRNYIFQWTMRTKWTNYIHKTYLSQVN